MINSQGIMQSPVVREHAGIGKLAEGEELGSNLLQVCLRSPASNYANWIPALATKHTYDLIFEVP